MKLQTDNLKFSPLGGSNEPRSRTKPFQTRRADSFRGSQRNTAGSSIATIASCAHLISDNVIANCRKATIPTNLLSDVARHGRGKPFEAACGETRREFDSLSIRQFGTLAEWYCPPFEAGERVTAIQVRVLSVPPFLTITHSRASEGCLEKAVGFRVETPVNGPRTLLIGNPALERLHGLQIRPLGTHNAEQPGLNPARCVSVGNTFTSGGVESRTRDAKQNIGYSSAVAAHRVACSDIERAPMSRGSVRPARNQFLRAWRNAKTLRCRMKRSVSCKVHNLSVIREKCVTSASKPVCSNHTALTSFTTSPNGINGNAKSPRHSCRLSLPSWVSLAPATSVMRKSTAIRGERKSSLGERIWSQDDQVTGRGVL